MQHLMDISTILLETAGHPRHAALKTLSWIHTWAKARSVALWRLEGDRITLALGMAIDALSEEKAQELWRGRPRPADGLAPMWDDSETAILVGTQPPDMLVYVDGIDKRSLDLPALATTAAIAANALRRSPGRDLPSGTAMSWARRDELIAALNLHEWNIARVSRVLGVTRKTIYDRMGRYQIARERVRR